MAGYESTGLGSFRYRTMNNYSSFGYSDLGERGRKYPKVKSIAGGLSYLE